MLVTLKLPLFHIQYIFFIDTVSGKLISLSPVKVGKRKSWFDGSFITESGVKKRIVCFEKSRYPLFKQVLNKPGEGLKLSHVKIEKDIIVNDNTMLKKVPVDIIDNVISEEFMDIQDAVSGMAFYDRFNIKGVLTNLSDIITQQTRNTEVHLRTATIHDTSGSHTISIFASDIILAALKNKESYSIGNVYVAKYEDQRVIKTSDLSTICKIKDLEIEVTSDEETAVSQNSTLLCRIVEIDQNTMKPSILCTKCKSQVYADKDGDVCCDTCGNMATAEECQKIHNLVCTLHITPDDYKLKHVRVPAALLQKLSVNMDNAMQFFKAIRKLEFSAVINLSEKVVVALDCTA